MKIGLLCARPLGQLSQFKNLINVYTHITFLVFTSFRDFYPCKKICFIAQIKNFQRLDEIALNLHASFDSIPSHRSYQLQPTTSPYSNVF